MWIPSLLLLCLNLPVAPLEEPGLTFADARHLLARTGFGGTLTEVESLRGLARADAVDRLLSGVRVEPQSALPDWWNEPRTRPRGRLSPEEIKKFRQERNRRGQELKGWWYQEMVATDSPLTERLTLFWHNHFTSSLRKVRQPRLLLEQNLLLRRHAAGNFKHLLHAISRDPAMVLYLDNQRNNKAKPNENFAREVLELFTLGEGHYTERDIKEAARAFTGWKVDRRTGDFRQVRRQHDEGLKEFLGKKGRFGGDEILDIILEQPRVATFITEKLWREFVSSQPHAREVERLAGIFREHHYELKPLLRALLLSPHFWDPRHRSQLVKSPVELIVGTIRVLEGNDIDGVRLAAHGRRMGQDLFDPPNVKGWTGGVDWISSATLLVRDRFLRSLFTSREKKRRPRPMQALRRARRMGVMVNPDGWARALAGDSRAPGEVALRLLLPCPPVTATPGDAPPKDAATLVRMCLGDPTYQLK